MSELTDFFKIQRCQFIDERVNIESDSRSLRFNQQDLVGQRFEMFLTSIPLTLEQVNEYMGGLNGLRAGGSFEVKVPGINFSPASNKTTSGGISSGDNQVTLNNVADLKVGRYFRFGNHQKVYQVTGISGSQITFHPNVITAVPTSTAAEFNNFPFSVKMRGRVQQFENDGRQKYSTLRINVVEVF